MTQRTPDSGFHLGSVYQSIEHLPRWYQIIALLSVFSLAYFRDNAVVEWTAKSLHSSLGTESIWYPPYQTMLEKMNFNERLCFTLYGVALSAAVGLMYQLTSRESMSLVGEANIVLPGHRWLTVALFMTTGLEAAMLLKEVIADTISDRSSLANLALHRFKGIRQTRFDPRLSMSNPHFIIQLELLKAYVSAFLWSTLPSLILSIAYRLCRDVPTNANPTLRWYIVTYTVSRVVVKLYWKEDDEKDTAASTWILLASTVVVWFTVNYLYGPARRCELMAATSRMRCVITTFKGLFQSWSLVFITYMSVLTIVVSVHVVELIAMWLMTFLFLLWIPAMIDSCSVDFLCAFVAFACVVARSMWDLTVEETTKLGALAGVWSINVFLLYSVVVNATRSRYGGVATLGALTAWALAFLGNEEHGVVLLQHASQRGLAGIRHHSPLQASLNLTRSLIRINYPSTNGTALRAHHKNASQSTHLNLFEKALLSGILLATLLLLIATLISHWQNTDTKVTLRRNHIVLVTFGILFRKFVHTAVNVFCVLISVWAAYVTKVHVIPRLTKHIPYVVQLGFVFLVGCTLLGSVMDTRDSLYEGAMRLLGVVNPPAVLYADDQIDRREAQNDNMDDDDMDS